MLRTKARSSRLAALVLATALAAAACSGDAQQKSGASPSTTDNTTSAAPAAAPQRWPLTGEKAGKLPDHRAAVVKIENTENSEPQIGLGSADLVVRELVEGGLTRLAAFYYSSMPSNVGPVRSMRGTDIAMVKPAHAVLVASGGAPRVMKRVRRQHVVTATEGTRGYHRVGDRPSPYNLFMNLKQLPKDKISGPRPPAYLPWGSAAKLSGGKRARHITVRFSGGSVSDWTWNGTTYRRSDSHAAKGDDFRPDSILALRVRETDAGYTDAAGNPVPQADLTGKGPVTLFHHGKAYQGAWTKKSAGAPLRLVTPKGERMRVPAGHTWIELVPTAGSGGDLRYGR